MNKIHKNGSATGLDTGWATQLPDLVHGSLILFTPNSIFVHGRFDRVHGKDDLVHGRPALAMNKIILVMNKIHRALVFVDGSGCRQREPHGL